MTTPGPTRERTSSPRCTATSISRTGSSPGTSSCTSTAACTPYAGPEKFKPPQAGPLKFETWLWGCDRCDGEMYHDGICVLTASGSVEFWDTKKINGWDDAVGVIEIGANSPDARLARMRFYPDR